MTQLFKFKIKQNYLAVIYKNISYVICKEEPEDSPGIVCAHLHGGN